MQTLLPGIFNTVPSGGDVTAPTLSGPTDAANGQTASTGSVSTDEGNGTLYSVATTSSTAPTAAQVKLGQDHTGSAATSAVSQAVSATGVQTVNHAGLTAATQYYTHYMHEDAASNQSTVVSASGFVTSAAGNPELLPNPDFSTGSHWVPQAGVTIQNGAAEWRSPAQWSTFTSVTVSTASMAPVSGNTGYTWGCTVANLTSGGNLGVGVSWYDSGGTIISTDEAALNINADGTFTRTMANSPANAAFAAFRAKAYVAGLSFNMTAASIKAT